MFVCHGNICRSPMAQCLLVHILSQSGRNDVCVESAATSTEELGNTMHPGALAELRRHGIPIIPHRAVQLRRADASKYDIFIGMDMRNVWNMQRILGREAEDKCFRLLELCGVDRDIADPWYSGDFTSTWNDIEAGCTFLAEKLQSVPNYSDYGC